MNNKNNKYFKFLLLNKRDSNIIYKIDQINEILNKNSPHFFIINEFQKHKFDTTTRYNFPGYVVEHDKLDKDDGWSRTAILIRQNIKYTRRKDLEDTGTSTVWIQVGIQGQKQFLIQALYRQYQRQGLKNSKSHKEQTNRWTQIIEKWKIANKEGREVITLGDTNIDTMVCNKPINQLSQFDRQRQKFYNTLKENILDGGTTIVNTEFTRHDNPPHGRKSCLDQVYTTHPLKITHHTTTHSTFSDHALIEIHKAAKDIKDNKQFIRIRTMKNFDKNYYSENIINHFKYITTLYEKDPEIITKNITEIIQESASKTAPIKRIQLSLKNKVTLSESAQNALIQRDIAHLKAKEDPTIENTREFKNLRNSANRLISHERFQRKKLKFQETTNMKQKWELARTETGQLIKSSPSLILDQGKPITKPKQIAEVLNRQYISTIRDLLKSIPQSDKDPLISYKKCLGPIDQKLNLQQISMSQLTQVLDMMPTSNSSAADYISVKLIKSAQNHLKPLLLHLFNQIIITEKFPETLKVTKIIPIRKKSKPSNLSSGWRPINIVPSISKVLEKCLLIQITTYLSKNNLINHTHHGSIPGKGTQTLIHELYDQVLEALENGGTTAIVQTDQSKAFDVVDHEILTRKMRHLGFNTKTMAILESYLNERKQYVEVNSFASTKLLVGPNSVTQGSALSCTLYLIMILDITSIYHNQPHKPSESATCPRTNAKSFVDDNILHVKANRGRTIQQEVQDSLGRLEEYTNSNKLALNPEKSKIMVITKDKTIQDNFEIQIHGKTVHHQSQLTILGTIFSQDLKWEQHIKSLVIPQLSFRLRTLKNVAGYMDQKFKQTYASAIFRGKLIYSIDAWGGASQTSLTKIQTIQDKAAKFILGPKAAKKSTEQRRQILKWPSIQQEIRLSTLRITHNIVHNQIPEELATKMKLNTRNLTIKKTFKLDTKPKHLNLNKRTQGSYRNRAYDFNTLPHRLTQITDKTQFKKWLKIFITNPTSLPNPIPPKSKSLKTTTQQPPTQKKQPSINNPTTTK